MSGKVTLASYWDGFNDEVFQGTEPDFLVGIIKNSFYAGASAFAHILDSCDDNGLHLLQSIDELKEEIGAYVDTVESSPIPKKDIH